MYLTKCDINCISKSLIRLYSIAKKYSHKIKYFMKSFFKFILYFSLVIIASNFIFLCIKLVGRG